MGFLLGNVGLAAPPLKEPRTCFFQGFGLLVFLNDLIFKTFIGKFQF